MFGQEDSQQVLWMTVCLMGAFGVVVLAAAGVRRLRGRSARSMLTKYAAWFIMLPPVVVPLVTSRVLFQLVVLGLSLQCVREFARATGLWADRGLMRLCYALTAAVYAPALLGWHELHQTAPVLVIGLLVLLPIVRGRYKHMLQEVCLAILGVLYFGWFLSHLAQLRNTTDGVARAFYLLVLVVCNDACGYLAGSLLGRHKLSPRLSPNKTVEGAIGGVIGSVGIALVLTRFVDGLQQTWVLAAAALIAVLGVCGDLVISFIKRDLAIKDMGRSIPGHGGLLDRCDSLILTAPMFFYLGRAIDAL